MVAGHAQIMEVICASVADHKNERLPKRRRGDRRRGDVVVKPDHVPAPAGFSATSRLMLGRQARYPHARPQRRAGGKTGGFFNT
ncbi:hypothetical protein [Rhizobium redzepovicii]|uniref:hypothetical protein n=1 Tax=Rhizobium redzepovicii TaxID=2867518 RepID=UPI0028712847|nr:hypothetical protein [Rhizobium redzepovicii]MDR9780998.1 hypothetical protein [Rhizobium redzepovicii]